MVSHGDERGNEIGQQSANRSPLVGRWRYLVQRPHAWRKQLWLASRRITVGQLISTIWANQWTVEQASENFEVPREAIEEALAYYEANRELIQQEAAAERRRLAERGYPLEPRDLPR